MRYSDELHLGKAGEYLVCADLLLKGHTAFLTDQGINYDVLLDTGKKLLKVQVKTTSKPRLVLQRANPIEAYIFSIKRCGKNNTRIYNEDEIDLFALVCLDTRKIGYILNKDMPTTINIRVDSLKGKYRDETGINQYEKIQKLKSIMNYTEIASALDMHISQVSLMCQDGYVPFKTNARYFSDFERDYKWFLNL